MKKKPRIYTNTHELRIIPLKREWVRNLLEQRITRINTDYPDGERRSHELKTKYGEGKHWSLFIV